MFIKSKITPMWSLLIVMYRVLKVYVLNNSNTINLKCYGSPDTKFKLKQIVIFYSVYIEEL